MDKVCSTCRQALPLAQFSVRRSARDGLQNRCKACWRSDYLDNTEQRKAVAAASARATLARHREQLAAHFAQHPCVDCGESDIRCLDLDHRDPDQKTANVSLLIALHRAWSRIEEEIAKCDVRCSSCHRKRTSEQRSDWRQVRWTHDAAELAALARARLAAIL